jgi:hypothetical protein
MLNQVSRHHPPTVNACDDDALRRRTANPLLQACDDGILTDHVRERAANVFLEASQDGRLETALGDMLASKEHEMAVADLSEEAVPVDLTEMRVNVCDGESLRRRAANLLLQACNDGILTDVLCRAVKGESATVSGKTCTRESVLVSDLAANVFLEASRGGRLETALDCILASDSTELSDEAVPVNLAETHMNVCDEGDPVCLEVCERAANVLLEASHDGRLETGLDCMLAPVNSTQMRDDDGLRRRTADLLLQACDNGILTDALMRTGEAAPKDLEVCEGTANVLVEAGQDGRLETALGGIPA